MSGELEERLRNHAQSFDSLLSLIPAKLYYGEDVSDQWKRKKQTPEQRRAAKMAKLDPDNWKSAKDIMDERSAAAKRKRNGPPQADANEIEHEIEVELPKAVQDLENPKAKKRKLNNTTPQTPAQPLSAEDKKQKKAEKKVAKKERAEKERERVQTQKARKNVVQVEKKNEMLKEAVPILSEPMVLDEGHGKEAGNTDAWSTASSNDDAPAFFSPPAESASSSISSAPPATLDQQSKKSSLKHTVIPPSILKVTNSNTPQQPTTTQSSVDREAARARLTNAISSFRSARKADDLAANKPRNRAELLDQRRRKEEAKKQAKREQRRKEREEAARKEDEEIARRFSPGGSGSLLGSPRSPPSKDNNDASVSTFSYGRIEFSDGSNLDPTNTEALLPQRKKKGPQDTQTALLAAQNKATRLANLDESSRKAIEDKDMWLNAKKRAHGERVRDDTSLLKKALKRQDSQKKKSEKEWDDRKSGIEKAQEARQKKRTENLNKRKESKMDKKAGKKSSKAKKRPGFEGSFRGRSSGGKKKS